VAVRRAVCRLALGLVSVLAMVAGGCERREPPAVPLASPTSATPAPEGTIVARIGGVPVTAAELDATLALRLHDVDRARFELRAARLRQLLVARVLGPAAAAAGLPVDAYVRREAAAAGTAETAFVDAALARAHVEVLLAAPDPPAVAVATDGEPARGEAAAPVTIVAFVDYQSPAVRAMAPVVQRVLATYAGRVRLVVRDFPLPLHRDAVLAAAAAGCAGEQEAFWPYHDRLLAAGGDLGRAALERLATGADLDLVRFRACLDDGRTRAAVASDAAAARALGLTVVPTFFVDGRYLRGPQPYEVLQREIDAALARRGMAPPSPRAAGFDATTSTVADNVGTALSRASIDRALADRAALARDLEQPAYDLGPGYEGRRLARVGRVPPGGLYEALGFESGDVLVTADGEPVLDDGAVLFDALRDRATVTVQVLRRGLPRTITVRID
jgi:protein-disulfide isomerase